MRIKNVNLIFESAIEKKKIIHEKLNQKVIRH